MEEDIKILEDLKNKINFNRNESKYENSTYRNALENLLTRYKQLEEKNEELRADNYELNNRITDLLENIPVQKVKEKIEELKKLITEAQKELGSASKEYTIYVYQKNILQELLEEGK